MKLKKEKIQKYSKMANAVRFLSADAVEKANSGHPGMPMGMAEVVTILFALHLRFNPQDSTWINRDRFILSAGHGSMLIYSLLYLLDYPGISLEDIKNFRKLGYPTAGHPEYNEIPGIETTTGPLGQGLGNGLGMAISEKIIRNRLGKDIINHHTYVLAGDGCLMEGISHEFASLSGHLELENLIVLYDDNKISIDGPTSLTMSDNTEQRFASMGWHVNTVDGYDFDEINNALLQAKNDKRPSIICCQTKIGFGSPNKEGKETSHGSPIGEEELLKAKEKLNWNYSPFEVPNETLENWKEVSVKNIEEHKKWIENKHTKITKFFDTHSEFKIKIEEAKNNAINHFLSQENSSMASRKSSEYVIKELITKNLNIIGGSADLSGSNNTFVKLMKKIKPEDFTGNYIHWGVREHCMAAAMTGISLHGFFIPYGGTFLVFSDYFRPSIRLAALMKKQVIYVLSHDSIGLGEDGPTHQPIEHLSSLRGIPNLKVFRPCDSIETAECWSLALLNKTGPSVIALSRQNLPLLRNDTFKLNKNYCSNGAYVLKENINSKINIFASGSEVSIAFEASNKLMLENINVNVISVPCMELFQEHNVNKKNSFFHNKTNIYIEAGTSQSWDKWIRENDVFIGLENYGASGPGKELYQHFGITAERIIKEVKNIIAN